jgi:hypothetical protein
LPLALAAIFLGRPNNRRVKGPWFACGIQIRLLLIGMMSFRQSTRRWSQKILESLVKNLRLLASHPGATAEQVADLKSRFPAVPDEYVKLVDEATEVELRHDNGQYIRI